MSDTLLIVASSSLINLLLAALILVRNPKLLVNRIFGFFAASVVIWTACNYLADYADIYNLLYTRLTFAAAILMAFSIYFLSNIFPSGDPLNRRRFVHIQIGMAILIVLIALSPALVPSVIKSGEGVRLEVGPGYYLYLLYIIQLAGFVIANFVRRYRVTNDLAQAQIRLLLAGILGYTVLVSASNLVIPLLANNWSSSKFGPVSTLVFVGFTAYAIVKHQLLDIKMVIARSLGYILAVISLSILFASIGFVVLNRFVFEETPLSLGQQMIFVVMALALASTLPRLKRFFDKITDRIFYRDAYDPQELLDALNEVLVSTIDIEDLLRECSDIIEQHLKVSYCLFGLPETEYAPARVFGVHTKQFKNSDFSFITDSTPAFGRSRVMVIDNLDSNYDQLRQNLGQNNVGILARLVTGNSRRQDSIGYLILGNKKSGNIFNSQDIAIVTIIANEFAIALQNALRFDEIERFNLTLQQRVDEATKKLRRTNAQLRALDEAKDDFISMASHQLRTPLTSIKGYTSMVLEGDAGEITETQKKLLTQSFYSAQRMVYLIADLLNVSRIRTGKFVIEQAPVNLASLVSEELEQLKEEAASRSLTLTYKKPDHFPELLLDETKTRQVIMNFVDNAIYYTPAGGHVTVELIDKPESIEFLVQDDGIGVPKAEQPHLFTKFYRANNARKARPDGTGLGLFMAKKVIIAQGGAIIFSSHAGPGSTFGFTISKPAKPQPNKV